MRPFLVAVVVLAVSLLIFQTAYADPPPHAKAWGKKKQQANPNGVIVTLLYDCAERSPDEAQMASFRAFVLDSDAWFWDALEAGKTFPTVTQAVCYSFSDPNDDVLSGYEAFNWAYRLHASTGALACVIATVGGGWAGSNYGVCALGDWTFTALQGLPPPPDVPEGWLRDLWPNAELGAFVHEEAHAAGADRHDEGLMCCHWDWPNTYLSSYSQQRILASGYVIEMTRPTGNYERWM